MPNKLDPDLQALFDAISAAGPHASIDTFNRFVAENVHSYNSRPQAELGGLSPDQMQQLLHGDWRSTGALQLNADLSADELQGIPFLDDARTLLTYVRDEGCVKETPARNLTRAAVAELVPRLRMPDGFSSSDERGTTAPVNEGDVLWLQVLRHTLLFAGLLARRKGVRITAHGRELLVRERAGALYLLLFETLFRKVDLRALDRDDRHAGLQSTMSYSFYKLREARDWSSPETLSAVAWLASAKDPATPWEAANTDFRHWAFRHRVLTPLAQFGLLEMRSLPSDDPWQSREEFRVTPLFSRFIRFAFSGAAARDPFLMRQ